MGTSQRAGARRKRADLIFAAWDPFNNMVRLERNTWESHISPKHPEVSGRDADIKQLIGSPDLIKGNTKMPDVAFFEGFGLRAIVLYESEQFTGGDSFGRIATVYANDGTQPANVGGVLYTGGTESQQVKVK